MIAFSFFVSPIPYAAVVALYGFYLLLVQFNESYDNELTEAEKSQKQIVLQDQNPSNPAKVYVVEVADYTDNLSGELDKPPIIFESLPELSGITFFDQSEQVSDNFFCYHLFSRPPPTLA